MTARRNVIKLAIVLVAIILVAVIFQAISRIPKLDESLVGKTLTVSYEELNVRTEPNGEVIGTLSKGDKVTATGNKVKLCFADTSTVWYEIILHSSADGNSSVTAWVAYEGIR